MNEMHLIILVLFIWGIGMTGMAMWLAFKLDAANDQIAWLTFDKNYLSKKLTKETLDKDMK